MQPILSRIKEPRFRSRAVLILLAALFIFPVVAAYVLFYIMEWRPQGMINTGELIKPVQMFPKVSFATTQNKSFNYSDLKHSWILFSVSDGICDEACQFQIYKMRQIDTGMADKQERIERLFIIRSNRGNTQFINKLSRDYPEMWVIKGPDNAVNDIIRTISKTTAPKQSIFNKIYVVDPMGNLIMRYKPDADPKGVLKDLTRLLRFSHQG